MRHDIFFQLKLDVSSLLHNYTFISGGKDRFESGAPTMQLLQPLHIIFAISPSSSETGAIKLERGGEGGPLHRAALKGSFEVV